MAAAMRTPSLWAEFAVAQKMLSEASEMAVHVAILRQPTVCRVVWQGMCASIHG